MAEENENGQEKTEQPTAKKLADAKKKGQVPRSKELNSMTTMVFGALGILFMGSYMLSQVTLMMTRGFSISRAEVFDHSSVFDRFESAVVEAFSGIMPFLVLMAITVIFTPLLLGGWSFSVEALAFKGERINPLKGLKRIFSSNGLMELVKAIAKFLLVSAIAVVYLWTQAEELLGLGAQPLSTAMSHGAYLLGTSFLIVSCGLIIISAIDVPFQLWSHSEKLKMTLQEVRDEMKETEGKPEVKSKIRQLQQQMAQHRMMEAVPDADVIITNPTHYAVALKYKHEEMAAPLVVAMGKDLVALKIREIAKAHNVEIFEAPPLARALYATSRIDQEIAGHLYFAVAQVLAFVFQLRNARAEGLDGPARPDIYVPSREDI